MITIFESEATILAVFLEGELAMVYTASGEVLGVRKAKELAFVMRDGDHAVTLGWDLSDA
jgi:hypothetical protein